MRQRKQKAWRDSRIARGLCGTCGKEPLEGKARGPKCKAAQREAQRQYLAHPVNMLKKLARRAIELALRGGTLVKPKHCEECGTRRRTTAHHDSYDQADWLKVGWLCADCHGGRHRIAA